jgi:hypothetical protein
MSGYYIMVDGEICSTAKISLWRVQSSHLA